MANQTVSIVNLLFLLKDEPKSWTELYQSGVFYGWRHLYCTVRICKKAGLIVKDHREWYDWDSYLGRKRYRDWFAITTVGLNFLKFYDNEEHPWRIQKFRVGEKQVAVS